MIKLLSFVVVLAVTAFAVTCPYHSWAVCTPTAQYKYIENHSFQLYTCTCGDDVWVREH